jgi:hypothetical protein
VKTRNACQLGLGERTGDVRGQVVQNLPGPAARRVWGGWKRLAFGTAGQAVGDFSDSWDLPAGMVVAADGSTLIGISPDSLDGASMSGNLGLVRHDVLGKSDGVFGKLRWKWTTATGTLASRATSFAMQADGKLLLAGLVENPGGNQDFAVMRLVKEPGW